MIYFQVIILSLLDIAIYWKYRHVDYGHIELFSNINIILKKEIHLYGSLSAIKQMPRFIAIKYFYLTSMMRMPKLNFQTVSKIYGKEK